MKAFDGGEVVGGSCDDVSRRPVPHVDGFLLPDKVPLLKVQNPGRTKYSTSPSSRIVSASVADPGSGALLNPGSGILDSRLVKNQDLDPG